MIPHHVCLEQSNPSGRLRSSWWDELLLEGVQNLAATLNDSLTHIRARNPTLAANNNEIYPNHLNGNVTKKMAVQISQ